MFIQQDLEDEPTVPETLSVPDVEVAPPVAKPTDGAPAVASIAVDDTMAEETASSSPPYVMYAGIVFFMLTVPCAVYVCGGPRLTLLRRLVRKTRAGGYRRVSADDDTEK